MNNLSKDQTYLQILEEAKNFHNILERLSSENPVSKTNLTLVKQNNIILLLLINISQKLGRIYDKPSSSNTQDIEDIIKDINNLEIGKSKKPIAIPRTYTFGTNKNKQKGVSRTISEIGETSSNNDRLLRQADKYGT